MVRVESAMSRSAPWTAVALVFTTRDRFCQTPVLPAASPCDPVLARQAREGGPDTVYVVRARNLGEQLLGRELCSRCRID